MCGVLIQWDGGAGIVCIGGDGIVNEVLNGLVQRSAATGVPMASLPPVGIIPAGSDNSVAWSVLQVRDPASAALAIVKGLTVSVDVLRMQWGWGATPHVGLCTCYFGFMSDGGQPPFPFSSVTASNTSSDTMDCYCWVDMHAE